MQSRRTHCDAALPPPEDHTVLVVDDDPVALDTITATLREMGYRVETASSWVEAIHVFSSREVDLVLMDAVMPGVDGFKLTSLLRARARSYTPVVFLTGWSDLSARQLGIAAGADDFLAKPVDPFELRVRIAAMLRIRALTKALEDKTRRLAKLAHLDALTGLGNRRAFDVEFPQELARARRYGLDLSVALFDLDRFKAINDDFGHPCGDRVIALFGRVMTRGTRTCDRCYRIGGEEFVLLATQSTTAEAAVVVERLRAEFRRAAAAIVPERPCTVSAGLASLGGLGPGCATPSALLAAADEALYRAKHEGRDRLIRADVTVEDDPAPAANGPPPATKTATHRP